MRLFPSPPPTFSCIPRFIISTIYIHWAALARLVKKEQRWSKSPLAPPQCQCAKRVKIATVSTFLRSDRDEGSEGPKPGHCAGCCQKGPLSPWSSSGLIKFVLISFSFLSAHFCQKFLTDDFVLNEFLKWVSFCSAQVSCVVYLMKCLVINTVLVKFRARSLSARRRQRGRASGKIRQICNETKQSMKVLETGDLLKQTRPMAVI